MDRYTGKTITLIEHIAQSIVDILTTALKSRVMRRDYGSLLPRLIDKPANDEYIMQMMGATVSALAEWEPRINTTYVNFVDLNMNGQLSVEIEAILKKNNEPVFLQINLFGAPDMMNYVILGGRDGPSV